MAGRIAAINHHTDAAPGKAGSVMLVTFKLAGQKFHAPNGGPQYKFNESISLFVECETQGEIDEFWSKLSEGGKEGPCGWLTDRLGLSWQIAPTRLLELLSGDDRETAAAAMRAMFDMKKNRHRRYRARRETRPSLRLHASHLMNPSRVILRSVLNHYDGLAYRWPASPIAKAA
jgi:predicted 3-demethylubiquinone-9 3-methyltransferase (glyoxalase superfamily)